MAKQLDFSSSVRQLTSRSPCLYRGRPFCRCSSKCRCWILMLTLTTGALQLKMGMGVPSNFSTLWLMEPCRMAASRWPANSKPSWIHLCFRWDSQGWCLWTDNFQWTLIRCRQLWAASSASPTLCLRNSKRSWDISSKRLWDSSSSQSQRARRTGW